MRAEDLKGMDGRKVLIEGLIDDASPEIEGCVNVTFSDLTSQLIPHTDIREILPREIKEGDRVLNRGYQATVLAIHDGRAWVLYDSGRRDDWAVEHLTLAEGAR